MQVGERVKEARKRTGLSQVELASRTNLSLRTVQRIENNKNSPRGYTLNVLAEALSVDIDHLNPLAIQSANETKRILSLINISALSLVIVPFGQLIFPFFIWWKHRQAPKVDRVGSRILSFQLLWSLITYPLLSAAPFVNRWLKTDLPLIFIVLILSFALNVFVVLRTNAQLQKGNFEVFKNLPKML